MPTPVQSFTFGKSITGSVGTTGEDVVIPANSFHQFCIIQNTHATESLWLSFNTEDATESDVKILAGGSITLPFGPGNALYGRGSSGDENTTFAVIGA